MIPEKRRLTCEERDRERQKESETDRVERKKQANRQTFKRHRESRAGHSVSYWFHL